MKESLKVQLFPITILFLLCVLISPAYSQNDSKPQQECALIDKNQKAQYISFDRMSGLPFGVRLRLHNNSTCKIFVETSDTEDRVIQDGKQIEVHYLTVNRRKQTVKSGGGGDSVGIYELLSGYSLMFVVPLPHFKKCQDVAVPFSYAWEGDYVNAGAIGGVSHLVYFLHEDVPQNVLKKKCH